MENQELMHGMKAGDIVQIIDEVHAWYPSLLIVDEVKTWGVQAYVIMPKDNITSASTDVAYIRLQWSTIARVGKAEVVVP